MLFPIFSMYVPRWRCNLANETSSGKEFSKDCNVYKSCDPAFIEFENDYFDSMALEFDWFCGNNSVRKLLLLLMWVGSFSFNLMSILVHNICLQPDAVLWCTTRNTTVGNLFRFIWKTAGGNFCSFVWNFGSWAFQLLAKMKIFAFNALFLL